MKYFFLLILIYNTICVKAQDYYTPSLKEVVEKFDAKYASPTRINLSKNPKGWSLYEMEFKNNMWQKTSEQLFWSNEYQKFLSLDFTPKKLGSNTLWSSVINDAYNYEHYYYYGYENAYKDAINELSNKKNLTDTLLEGLARAYSAYARSLVENTTGYATTNKDTGVVEEKYIDSFIKYVDKGISTFKHLYELNPNYKTIVGSIYQKYCNEYMYAYMCLAEWGYENKANEYLKPGLYEDGFLDLVKNYFHSVEDNSILFTNGDNDTYPLLYLQLQKGFKRNVSIINLSLINKSRYINMIRKGYGGLSPIPMSVLPSAYNSITTSYIITQRQTGSKKNTTVEDLINMVNTKYSKASYLSPLSIKLINNQIALPVNSAACIAANILNPQEKQQKQILPNLEKYLYRGELAVLDILHNNNWQRNIYVAYGYKRLDMTNYLRNTGLMDLLYPTKNKANEYYNANDSTRLHNNLMNNYSVNAVNTSLTGKENDLIVSNIRNSYVRYLYKLENSDKEQVAEKGLSLIPNSYFPYDALNAQMASHLIKSQPKKAEDTFIIVIKNLYSEYISYKPLVSFYYTPYRQKKELIEKLNSIENIAKDLKSEEIKNVLKEINNKLKN